jgi:hypothetical protein
MGIVFIVHFNNGHIKYHDIEQIELYDGVTSILVSMRMGLATIFIIALAKWYSR